MKLIDVYPEQPPPPAREDGTSDKDVRGYELLVGGDIVRARFRDSLGEPRPLTPGKTEKYVAALGPRAHAFLRGHRIQVQVQSSWFPAFDRNPQTYVESPFAAREEDFVVATQRVMRSREEPSSVVLPVVR